MIVKKMWHTGYKHKGNYAEFEGWFLFGFIPLYIRQTAFQVN